MAETLAFTAAEVAFVLREPVKAIKKELDDGPIETKLVAKAGGSVRTVEWADLLYLVAMRSLREELTPKARNEFYAALKQLPIDRLREVRFGRLCVAMDDFRAEAEARARDLEALASTVDFRKDGEAVLKGTEIEVHRIAALLNGGSTIEDVADDHPSLTARQIAEAEAYAIAYPKPGRPYAKASFKRAMQRAGLEALDEVLDADG